MQLQGELVKAKDVKVKHYSNPFQALFTIGKHEGIRGLQKGLICAYFYQIGLNGCRLGLYDPVRTSLNKFFHPNEDADLYQNPAINLFSGTVTGGLGAAVISPLYLVKTRMQSYSAGAAIKVGQQTHYNNFIEGLISIYKNEGGVKGLFRGCDAAIIRTSAGSSIQLPLYNYTKSSLKKYDLMEEGTPLHLTASCITGIGVGIVMNPFDVVLTRVYNQRGNLYSGPIDCFIKTFKAEGTGAFFKGLSPALLRLGPHTILMLTFMETTMKWVNRWNRRYEGWKSSARVFQ